MASSEFDMSKNKDALLRKFQGNGWALTCSVKSQKEISAILGEEVSAKQPAGPRTQAGLSRFSQVPT